MKFSDKLLIVFYALVIPVLLLIAFSIIDHKDFTRMVDGLFVAAQEFWVGLGLFAGAFFIFACAWGATEIKRRNKVQVIGHTKHGPSQAVIHNGVLIQLNTPMLGTAQGNQITQVKEIIQAAELMARYARHLPELPQTVDADTARKALEAPQLPTYVRYEDIKATIPEGHALVGINERGVVTRERGIKALIWIPGGSGSGKTNTACLRVEEDYAWGHWFLVIDPHWFKDDSLWNAIKGYADRFIVPMQGAERPFAAETEEIIVWLDCFINEFKRRKAGGSWDYPITIIIDEIGSLVTDKTDDPQEIAMREKIKTVTRICGQESRNFEMTGMVMSQDAAGLAWLRKRAIMVIAHQLLMMSERMLACNDNAEIARSMDTWPTGRTLIYGIGFKEGLRVYQQPAFKPRVVDADPPRKNTETLLPGDNQQARAEANGEAGGSSGSENGGIMDLSTIKTLRDIGKRLKNGEEVSDIVKSFGLPYGRGTQELKATVEFVQEQMRQAGEL